MHPEILSVQGNAPFALENKVYSVVGWDSPLMLVRSGSLVVLRFSVSGRFSDYLFYRLLERVVLRSTASVKNFFLLGVLSVCRYFETVIKVINL